jgi:hypothetical protein
MAAPAATRAPQTLWADARGTRLAHEPLQTVHQRCGAGGQRLKRRELFAVRQRLGDRAPDRLRRGRLSLCRARARLCRAATVKTTNLREHLAAGLARATGGQRRPGSHEDP